MKWGIYFYHVNVWFCKYVYKNGTTTVEVQVHFLYPPPNRLSVYHVITIDQSSWKEDHVVCVLCLNVSSSNSEMVSAFIAFTTALSTFRSWAILSASIPEIANNLKKSISFPVNAFLNAGQKLLHHWGRGHNSIRWWLQLPMFRGDLWDRGLFLFSGNRKLFSVRGDHEEGRLISIKVCTYMYVRLEWSILLWQSST